jgi:hypothetical protein
VFTHTPRRGSRYWKLFDKLTPEAGKNVAYQNAFRMYFESWTVPPGAPAVVEDPTYDRRYAQIDPVYDTECLDPAVGMFVSGIAEGLDDDGKY